MARFEAQALGKIDPLFLIIASVAAVCGSVPGSWLMKGVAPVTQEKIDEMVEKIKKLAEDAWRS